jgi:hypothetical protein
MYLDAARESLVIQSGRLEHSTSCEAEAKHIEKGIVLLCAACDQWELTDVWLRLRRSTYEFLVVPDLPYPVKFMNQDDKFYMSLLSGNEYDLLRILLTSIIGCSLYFFNYQCRRCISQKQVAMLHPRGGPGTWLPFTSMRIHPRC